jgi:pheromone receptor transcription factor
VACVFDLSEKLLSMPPKRTASTLEEDCSGDEKSGANRKKIKIEYIQDRSKRHITFSKRKAGIMKKVAVYKWVQKNLIF